MPRKTRRKAEKFPLTLHRTGQWSKSFTLPSGRRRTVYFGTDRDAALVQYVEERESWQAGVDPRENRAVATAQDMTVREVVNYFLTAQKQRMLSGEIRPRTFHELKSVGERTAGTLGRARLVSTLSAADFERFKAKLAETNSPASVAQLVNKVRSQFKYCVEAGLLEKLPTFGPHFRTPGKRAMRQAKNARPVRMFGAKELRTIIDKAPQPLKAWILLGINCGYGAADISTLPIQSLDLDGGWISHERAKTATIRRCPLWPETVEAVREAMSLNRSPRDPADAELAFLNSKGNPLVNDTGEGTGTRQDTVGKLFREHLATLGIRRTGVGHYALRHTHRTVADEVGDDRAARLVMGHVEDADDMGSHYVHRISDDRLRRVTDHIRHWLLTTGVETS